MLDPRLTNLADMLVNYSTKVQKGDNVLIDSTGIDTSLAKELVKAVHKAGGHPFVNLRENAIRRQLLLEGTEEQFKTWAEIEKYQIEKMQACIIIDGGQINEMSDVPDDKIKLFSSFYQSAMKEFFKSKWIYLRYPTPY
ncbi:aminopeptidase, partial [Enterobacter quasiroggenkampii]|nr:aminopeptidase [Enterobacter quasiroggenkampii]